MDYLAVRGYDVYALDMRGMGQSVYSASDSTIFLESRLQDAIAVASRIVANTGRAPVVMGWSQGGVIAGMLASYAAPQLVAGVGLFSVGEGPFTVPAPFQPAVQLGPDRDCERHVQIPSDSGRVFCGAFWH